jgi:hypothetical protein
MASSRFSRQAHGADVREQAVVAAMNSVPQGGPAPQTAKPRLRVRGSADGPPCIETYPGVEGTRPQRTKRGSVPFRGERRVSCVEAGRKPAAPLVVTRAGCPARSQGDAPKATKVSPLYALPTVCTVIGAASLGAL